MHNYSGRGPLLFVGFCFPLLYVYMMDCEKKGIKISKVIQMFFTQELQMYIARLTLGSGDGCALVLGLFEALGLVGGLEGLAI